MIRCSVAGKGNLYIHGTYRCIHIPSCIVITGAGLSTRSLFVRSSFVLSRSYCPPQLYSSVEEHPQPVEGKIQGIEKLLHNHRNAQFGCYNTE